ncbi:hypothetical protein Lal_00026758 [Lupinus albus]|nr:hypothetical protein Lal_00026758 [Lupinus albus]
MVTAVEAFQGSSKVQLDLVLKRTRFHISKDFLEIDGYTACPIRWRRGASLVALYSSHTPVTMELLDGWRLPGRSLVPQPRYIHVLEEHKYQMKNDQCYSCGRKGHFAIDFWFRKAEGNHATFDQKIESEEGFDLKA